MTLPRPPHDNRPAALPPGAAARLSALGPLFAVDTHPVDTAPPPPWQPATVLLDDRVLRDRVTAVRARLTPTGDPEAVEPRVAASVVHLNLVGRLLAPILAMAALTGEVVAVHLDDLWWQPTTGGPVPLSVPDLGPQPGNATVGPTRDHPAAATGTRVADLLARRVLAGPIRDLTRAVADRWLPATPLWGNVASATATILTTAATTCPDAAERANALLPALLARPPLRNTGRLTPAGAFRRRSCCLVNRLAPSRTPVCPDCVHHDAPPN